MASNNVMALTDDTFDAEIGSSDLPVLVDFYADWCVDCRMIAPAIEEIAEQYAGRLTVAKVDTEAQPALTERFGIGAIPVVIVFRDGQEAAKVIGRQTKNDVVAALKQAGV